LTQPRNEIFFFEEITKKNLVQKGDTNTKW